ncbi:MAG TPA: electron transport complex subunit RsxC [Candidatus Polarisedimenticolaceae bacterium]|nr:electron transport complex subunit RsxC [Candidatus Polarisedimenticolaceae bacterium]
MSASLLGRAATFRHGVHPDELKERTRRLAIERMPFVRRYVVPLSQHAGAPSRALVGQGMRVRRGQLIAAPDGWISTAQHAPVSGSVVAIESWPHPLGTRVPAIVIEIDPFDNQRVPPGDPPRFETMSQGEIVERIQLAGLVGLGGAAFPSHVKLRPPDGKRAAHVVLNGCECEPYLTCDHRVMLERAGDVIEGLRILMRVVGASTGYVGVELNKNDAIDALREVVSGDRSIKLLPLEVKYPQGAEKMLIDAIFHREVPSGGLPLDLDIVVNNVGTAAAIAELFRSGRPLIERVITVSGPGVDRPSNLLVPIGTPIRDVLRHCGMRSDTRQVILGGPMMGMAQKSLEVPVIKGISAVIALTGRAPVVDEEPCIRCGRCLDACPVFLNPSRIAAVVRSDDHGALEGLFVQDCCECASCSFVCPSNIPLVQLMRMGKALVRRGRGG